jgi:hypothetical protein
MTNCPRIGQHRDWQTAPKGSREADRAGEPSANQNQHKPSVGVSFPIAIVPVKSGHRSFPTARSLGEGPQFRADAGQLPPKTNPVAACTLPVDGSGWNLSSKGGREMIQGTIHRDKRAAVAL